MHALPSNGLVFGRVILLAGKGGFNAGLKWECCTFSEHGSLKWASRSCVCLCKDSLRLRHALISSYLIWEYFFLTLLRLLYMEGNAGMFSGLWVTYHGPWLGAYSWHWTYTYKWSQIMMHSFLVVWRVYHFRNKILERTIIGPSHMYLNSQPNTWVTTEQLHSQHCHQGREGSSESRWTGSVFSTYHCLFHIHLLTSG